MAPPRPARIQHGPSLARKQAVNNDMRAKGLTDYATWRLHHTLNQRHTVMQPCNELIIHRVLAVVRLDNPRDDTREQGPMDFAASTGDQEERPWRSEMLYRRGWSVTL